MTKHVLVLYQNPMSARFLAAQDTGLESKTRDGAIQFHHFNEAQLPQKTNVTKLNGSLLLEECVAELREKLREHGETIDALVIPSDHLRANNQNMLDYARALKQQIPTMQVVVVNPDLSQIAPNNNEGFFALPEREDSVVTRASSKAFFYPKGQDDSYWLAPGVDCLIMDVEGKTFAPALREALNMPALAQTKGRAR